MQHQTHQQQTARFTFGESTARVSEGMDDTRIDLTQVSLIETLKPLQPNYFFFFF